MSPAAAAALGQLQRLSEELRRRRPFVERRLRYYRGLQPLTFASDEFTRYFGGRYVDFCDNWCVPVIQTPAERMDVLGMRVDVAQREVDKDLARVWRANDAERGSSEAFVVALAAARAFVMVWGDPADEQTPRICWEHPAETIVGYDPDTGERVAALKLWRDDAYDYATVYTRTEVWKWQRASAGMPVAGKESREDETDWVSAAFLADSRGLETPVYVPLDAAWEPRQGPADDTWPIRNPLGVVPVVEMRNQTLLDDLPISDIDGVIAMQDAINLVWAYLLNALDFASLSQRVILGAEIPKVPILGASGEVTGYRPIDLAELLRERVLWVPGENAKLGEWSPAILTPFTEVIERAVEHVAAQTRTPPHYLIGKLANLSAEALTAAETGLVSKTGERVTYFSSAIRETFRLVALAQDNNAKAKAIRSGTVVWADIQFRSLAQKVDALVKMRQIGFPMEWIAEQYGLEPHEVTRVMELIADEREQDPVGALTKALGQGEPAGGMPPERMPATAGTM
jgi:hypothetical protein